METVNDLVYALKAQLPGIHVRSLEEPRAIQALRRACAAFTENAKTLWQWSAAAGLREINLADGSEKVLKEPAGFDEVITDLISAQSPVVLALCDPWDELQRSIFQSYLKRGLYAARGAGKCIVLVGKDWKVPAEVQDQIMLIDLPLPTKAELLAYITQLANAYAGNERLKDKIKISKESLPELARACTGLTLDEAKGIVALALVKYKGLNGDAIKMALAEKKQIIARGGILQYEEADRGMNDVGGLAALKSWIIKRKKLFSDEARAAGINAPKGVLLVGVPGCLHQDTPIYDPIKNTTMTVKERAMKGEDFHVWSLSINGPVIAKAQAPLPYKFAPMICILLDNGSKITVTPGHKLWNGKKWITAAEVCELLSLSGPCHLASISGHDLEALRLDVFHLTRIRRDYLNDYQSHPYLDDEQLLFESNNVQETFPLQDDAPAHNHDKNMDAVDSIQGHKLDNQSSPLICGIPSKLDCVFRLNKRTHLEWILPILPIVHESATGLNPCGSKLVSLKGHDDKGAMQQERACESTSSKAVSLVTTFPELGIAGTGQVVNAEYTGSSIYYDFHVPLYENYWACGMWHHNTGKTLCARAIASAWNCPLVRLDAGRLFGSLVGESESNLRQALRTAESVAPCVLMIDELEKAFSQGGGGDGGTSQRVFGGLLSWLQDKKADVFVVATANDISKLPPELLRKGRFDEVFFVDLPDEKSRKEILNIHLERAGHEIDTAAAVNTSIGYTGAELESAVQSALIEAFQTDRAVTIADVTAAVKATVPLSKTMSEQIQALRQWAASGRAVMAGGAIEVDAAKNKTRATVEI